MNDRVPEITRLLSKLASNLRNPSAMLRSGVEDDDPTCELSISQLTQSLNQGRETRVLDTALSLMCFKAPHVFDSLTEYLVKTLVSIMSSSVSCKVLRFRAQEALLIGGSIPGRDCPELIEACVDVLGKMENHEMLCHLLSSAVVRVALLASCYHYLPTSIPILDAKPIDLRRSILKLLRYLPSDIIVKKHVIPVRLLLWYLDPLSLKQDVTNILKEILQRPFLSLDEEFHERMDWRCIIICLALSPSMFVQTRALLHNWFLVTGLASVLELLGELILLIMDIISRPPRWGIPMEVGSNLPFSNAYIPHKHDLLRILVGPVSSESFLKLVYLINVETPFYKKRPEQTLMLPAIEIAQIDHASNWALAMNFPDWFFFASVLLFSEQNFQESFQLKCLGGDSKTEGTYAGMSSPSLWAAAASYIAWILSPFSKSHQDLVIDCLSELMGYGCLNEFSPDKHSMDMAGCKSKTKVKKPKVRDSKEDYALREDKNGQTIVGWLKEFQNIHMRYWSKTVNMSSSRETKTVQDNLLFRRIPLGILIDVSHNIDEDGCEVLLHYATTGTVLEPSKSQFGGLKHMKLHLERQEDSITWPRAHARKEAMAGASLVFKLTDIAERISDFTFETEDELDFVCKLKSRMDRYLLKCVKRLSGYKIEKMMATDLCIRLTRWRHQGRDVSLNRKDWDDAINSLHKIVSSF